MPSWAAPAISPAMSAKAASLMSGSTGGWKARRMWPMRSVPRISGQVQDAGVDPGPAGVAGRVDRRVQRLVQDRPQPREARRERRRGGGW